MIRKLLATTAFATVLATGAFAQETTTAAPAANDASGTTTMTPAQNTGGQMQMNGYLASNLIGETVYTSAAVQAAQDAAEGEATTATTDNQTATTTTTTTTTDGQTAQTGETVQTTTTGEVAEGDQMAATGQAQQTGENIGEVNDVVIGKNGQVEAVVVGVGGFLGIGEKNVALPFSEVQWQQDGAGDQWMVVNQTRESLEALPEFDTSMYEPAANTATNTTGTTNGGMAPATGAAVGAATGAAVGAAGTAVDNAADATANAANNAADATGNAVNDAGTAANTAMNNAASGTGVANTTDQTQTGAIDRSTLQEISQDQLTAETLVGTTVYGANDENIGEIGDIVLTQDGQVDAVLVDVGGFLGIGEKRVAVGMDKLQFLQDGNGNRYLYTNFSEEQLNAQAAYDEGTYSQARDQQRLIVQ